MKKNMMLLGGFCVVVATSTTIVGCLQKKNEVIKINIEKIKDFDTQLGALNNNEKDTIIAKFIAKNPNKKLVAAGLDIEINATTNSKAIIKAKDTYDLYTGRVEVSFTIKENINNLNLISDLGLLQDDSHFNIITTFINKNPNKNLVADDLEVLASNDNIGDNFRRFNHGYVIVRISVKDSSNNYQGIIDASYNVEE